jgi:hypothetical protein
MVSKTGQEGDAYGKIRKKGDMMGSRGKLNNNLHLRMVYTTHSHVPISIAQMLGTSSHPKIKNLPSINGY